MRLSIIIPAYNEEKTVLKAIKAVEAVNLPNIEKEIIIVDDFSKDGTREVLKNLKKHKVIFRKENGGKGAAIRTGLKASTGDIILIQDADLEYDPNDYYKLLKPILEGKTKVVYGSRFLRKHRARYQAYYLGNILLSLLTKLIYLRRITDMETGYKVFKREVADKIKLKANGFDIEPEITAKIIKKGYRIIEIPIRYECRSFEEGKKITWKDGLKALWCLIKYRFVD